MKICKNCGTSVEENAVYCPKCGKSMQFVEENCHSVLGIAAFVLSVSVSAIAGLICGIVDVSVNKKNKHGLSVAAIVVSACRIVLGAVIICLALNFSGKAINNLIKSHNVSISETAESHKNIKINVNEETTLLSNEFYKVQISDFDYYVNGKTTTFGFSVLMLENHLEDQQTITIGYKLLNSEGKVVATDLLFTNFMGNGSTFRLSDNVKNLSENEEYTIKFVLQ